MRKIVDGMKYEEWLEDRYYDDYKNRLENNQNHKEKTKKGVSQYVVFFSFAFSTSLHFRAPLKIPALNFDLLESRYHDSWIRGTDYGPTGIF